METHRGRKSRERKKELGTTWIPVGDLERIRVINQNLGSWVDEQEFIRDAVRRRIDEFRGYLSPPGRV